MSEAFGPLWCDNVSDFVYSNYGILGPMLRFVWILGLFGNLVNIVVFGRKHMIFSPSNRILFWLSITDLLAMISAALYAHGCEWCTRMDSLLPETFVFWALGPNSEEPTLLQHVCYFLLQMFHTVSTGLTIALVFERYIAVTYPPLPTISCAYNWSVGSTVRSLYVISYILGLPAVVIAAKLKGMQIRNGPQFVEVMDFHAAYSMFVHCVPYFILILSSVTLIFAVIRGNRSLQWIRACGTDYAHETTVITLFIVPIYLITDLPSILWFFLPSHYSQCFKMVRRLRRLFFLMNCSYNILIYLALSPQYRKTVIKLILSGHSETGFNTRDANRPLRAIELEEI